MLNSVYKTVISMVKHSIIYFSLIGLYSKPYSL